MRATLIWCSLFIISASKQLPLYIEKCSLSGKEKLGECLKDRFNQLKPGLEEGIPELKLPKVVPLHIPQMEVSTDESGNVTFQALLTDVDVYGINTMTVKAVGMDFETKHGFVQLQLPQLNIIATFDVKGAIMLFKLQSKGQMSANITDFEGKSEYVFDVVSTNGKKYIDVKYTKCSNEYSFKSAKLQFDNLFENKELNDQFNTVINDNLQELSKEVGPFLYDALRLSIISMIRPVFEHYSIEELFVI